MSKAPNEVGYADEVNNIAFTLLALDSLSTCVNKVSQGLNGTVLTEIVKNAWIAKHDSDAAFITEVKAQIVAKAKTLITNNPNVTVDDFVKKTDGTDEFTFTKPESAADSAKTISCKLHLTDTETEETEDTKSSFEAELTTVAISAIAEFQTPAELATAVQTGATVIDYVATKEAALDAIKAKVATLSKNPAYSTSTITVTESTTDGSTTVFTAPSENDGSITNVVVTTGEGDSCKVTLTSVKINKQQTTPAPAPEG